ncbi:mCG19845, partial [Mus musculus]
DLSSIPRTRFSKVGIPKRLSSDSHIQTMACVHTCTQKENFKKPFFPILVCVLRVYTGVFFFFIPCGFLLISICMSFCGVGFVLYILISFLIIVPVGMCALRGQKRKSGLLELDSQGSCFSSSHCSVAAKRHHGQGCGNL